LVDIDEIREVVAAITAGGWAYASITTSEFTLTVGEAAAGALAAAPMIATPAQPVPVPTITDNAHTVTPRAPSVGEITIEAPSMGIFWRSPKPGAPAFVEVGQTVSAGDTLALLEVMKLYSTVKCHRDGIVREILMDNGAFVEYESPLFIIETQ
jgi:acetyl-CoA carboxylase biotin carboxyl carrier protein